ncbi:hypothetical protein [Actinokineospora sp. UTMC 2448]|uniref:hypothetical protein n=1 Tax=Actinokineospora sp. UTMC 2448 TaxID=2268449 RepID=UPI0021640DF0|nr:hypothetical protein [Actinokineospora sp. UTMC 2448]UVS81683.1 hypothetical protein Actkin_05447 [Actinokineospora sp. UTMC 2448]
MSTDFDTLLQDTLKGMADRAPDPTGVRAALDRSRRARRPLAVLVAVTVAAAAVLAVAMVPVSRVDSTPGGVLPIQADPAVWEHAFDLNPTWLPDGLTEQSRTASVMPSRDTRVWDTGPVDEEDQAALLLHVDHSNPVVPTNAGAAVDLGAMGTGRYYENPGRNGVIWNFDDKMIIVDAADRFDQATVVRVARGLRVGATSFLRTTLRFAAEVHHRGAGYGVLGTPTGRPAYTADVATGSRTYSEQAEIFVPVRVELTPVEPLVEGGTEIRVRGTIGRLVTRPEATTHLPSEMVVVPVGDRWLVVRNFGVRPNAAGIRYAVEIAETVIIGPDPANEWIGTR